MADENPLEITIFKDAETDEDRAYVPLDKLPEDIVEDLRKRYLETNTGDQEGQAPPGIKDNAAQTEQVLADALANPIDKRVSGSSPSDALG